MSKLEKNSGTKLEKNDEIKVEREFDMWDGDRKFRPRLGLG